MEQKYGQNNPNQSVGNGGPNSIQNQAPKATSSGLFSQTTSLLGGLTNNNNNNNNNNNGNNPNDPGAGSGLSSLTSSFTSGIANLKLSASTFQTNKFSSFLNNPFS